MCVYVSNMHFYQDVKSVRSKFHLFNTRSEYIACVSGIADKYFKCKVYIDKIFVAKILLIKFIFLASLCFFAV
jgi:hypothetical protein